MAHKQLGKNLIVANSCLETLFFIKKSLKPHGIGVMGEEQFRYFELYTRMTKSGVPAWLDDAFASNQPLAEVIREKMAELASELEAHDRNATGRLISWWEIDERQRHIKVVLTASRDNPDYDLATVRLAHLDRESFGKPLKSEFYGIRKQIASELNSLSTMLGGLAKLQHSLPLARLIKQHNSQQGGSGKEIGMLISFQPYAEAWPVIYARNLPRSISGLNADFFISQARKANRYLIASLKHFKEGVTNVPKELFMDKITSLAFFCRESDQMRLAYGIVEAVKRAFGIQTA